MKWLLPAFLAFGLSFTCADGASLEFGGEVYDLAWKNPAGLPLTIDEYIQPRETLENWTRMIAVRRFLVPNASVDDILAKMVTDEPAPGLKFLVEPEIDKPEALARQDGTIVTFVVQAPGQQINEYNLWYYYQEPQGTVLALQFATRSYGLSNGVLGAHAAEIRSQQREWLHELVALDLKPDRQRPSR